MEEPASQNGEGPPAPAGEAGRQAGPKDAGSELADEGVSADDAPGAEADGESSTDVPAAYVCPHCGQPVDASASQAGPFIQCPHCRGQFMAAEETDENERARLELEAKQKERAESEELNATRVRQLAAGRKAAIRSRSHLMICAVLCFAAAVGLAYKVIQRVRYERFDVKAVGFILFGLAAGMGAAFFVRRAMAMTRDLELTCVPDPETPPDFSTLSDGTQHWKNLEEVE